MEPERRKLFKKKIKNCLEPETPEKVKRKKTVEQKKSQGDCTSLRPKTSLKNMPKTVTYLCSHSYMEQNKDLLVLQPLEGEKLSHNEENILQTKDEDQLQNENAPLDIIANITYKTPEKSPQAKKDSEVFNIKTPYKITKAKLNENIKTEMNEKITSQVCQIEFELEEENTEHNDDEIIDVFDTANPLIDKTAKKTDNENLLETEKVHCQQEITATDNEKLKIDRTQNREDTKNLSRNEEVYCRQEITATDTENLNIDRTQNKEDTENLSKTEVVRCQQEEKLHSEPSQEKEREKDDFLENRVHLTPSIMEIIPEKDMNIIRKSLEEENAQDNNLPSFPDNEEPQPKKQKRKQSVMMKSYVEFFI